MDAIEEMFEELIAKVDSFTEEESIECLNQLKKWENIGPTVQEYFDIIQENDLVIDKFEVSNVLCEQSLDKYDAIELQYASAA